MDNEDVKKNIERIRRNKAVKIEEICTGLNITRQAWYNYLSGGFSLATLNKIADALNVQVWELLKPDNENGETSNKNILVCPYCGKPLYVTIGPGPEK